MQAQLIKDSAQLAIKPAHTTSYAKYAVLAAVGVVSAKTLLTDSNLNHVAKRGLDLVVLKWADFERQISSAPQNAKYMSGSAFNYDNYYKGEFVDSDIRTFFAAHPLT